METTTTQARTFHARPFRRAFDEVPRHWLAGSALGTQLVNGLNLLFPSGERFFVKAVRRYEPRIEDPVLRRQIRDFYAQEGRHAGAHERYFGAMREQGMEIDGIIRALDWFLHDFCPRNAPPRLRLSVTVALEHYTAIMAELLFKDEFLADMHPDMRAFLMWHAAEEIEHKAVAFDVLRSIDPSYSLRISGLAVATAGLLAFWGAGTTSLLIQEKTPIRRIVSEAVDLARSGLIHRLFGRVFGEYLRRDFHPLTNDDYAMVEEFLTRYEDDIAALRNAA